MAKKTVNPEKQIDVGAMFAAVQDGSRDLPAAYIGVPGQEGMMDLQHARQLPKTTALIGAVALTFDAEVAEMRDAGHPVNPINPFKTNKTPIWNRLEKAITKAHGKERFK